MRGRPQNSLEGWFTCRRFSWTSHQKFLSCKRPGFWMTFVMRTAICSNTRVHKHFVGRTVSLSRWTQQNSKQYLKCKDRKKGKYGTDLVSTPINWNSSCALGSFLLHHNSDDCSSSKSLRRTFVALFLGNYMRLLYIYIYIYNQNVSWYLLSCPFCATVKFHPSWKNPFSEFLATTKARIRCVVS